MKVVRQKLVEWEEEVPDTLEGFGNWEFSSGTTAGADFRIFARLFKKFVKSALPPDAKLVSFDVGHYDLCGFIRKNGKFAYFSIPDVRYFPRKWQDNILVRTAKSEKDYTGGDNHYTSLKNFRNNIEKLIS